MTNKNRKRAFFKISLFLFEQVICYDQKPNYFVYKMLSVYQKKQEIVSHRVALVVQLGKKLAFIKLFCTFGFNFDSLNRKMRTEFRADG
jgi:hypothetical protein